MNTTDTTTNITENRKYGILLWDPTADVWQVVNNRIRFGSLDAAVKRAESELGKTAQSLRSGKFVDGEYVMPSFTVETVRAYNVEDGEDFAVIG